MWVRTPNKYLWLSLLLIVCIFLYIMEAQFEAQMFVSFHTRVAPTFSILKERHNISIKQKFNILFLSSWHGHDPATFLRVPECEDQFEIFSNHSEIDRADAIVFSYAEFDHLKDKYLQNIPKKPNVSWILCNQETASQSYPLEPDRYDGVFNFVWMFRRDADIHPDFEKMYEKFEKLDEKWTYGSDFSKAFMSNKTKLAAWVVANYDVQPGNRNGFVKELEKHGIVVDTFGKCGNHSCEGDYKEKNCFPRLGQQYKFYMALENSLCLDYITEKPAHGWENGMVPIIWGLGTKELAAPPGSYIDAMEFETIEELAARMKYLDKNPKEYFKYFEWRRVYNTTLSYHASYHCYASKKIRELTEQLRTSVKATETHYLVYGRAHLEYWRSYYYNEQLMLYCKNCIDEGFVNVTHPNQNVINLYNNIYKCDKSVN